MKSISHMKNISHMKKWILASLMAFVLGACEEEQGLDGDFLVYTNYDSQADFAAHETFFIPDSILLAGSGGKPQYAKGASTDKIIEAFAAGMEAMGYTPTDKKEEADLGLQLTLIDDTYYVVGHAALPPYWDPCYWGDWGCLYYPFPIGYSYSVGSLLADMVDLKAPKSKDEKLPVVWNACISGLSSGSKRLDTVLAVRGINQSFAQSGYLKK